MPNDVTAAMARLREQLENPRKRRGGLSVSDVRILSGAYQAQAQEIETLTRSRDGWKADAKREAQNNAHKAQEIARMCVERDAKEATISMTVARLGGIVEGAPTHRINFLQRIDDLRRIEALAVLKIATETECARLRKALEQQKPFLAFWRKIRESIFDGISDADAQEWAVEVGLLVEATYDPAVHGDCEADPGDMIYVDAPWMAVLAERDD